VDAAALQRRFLLGPLVALALLGPAGDVPGLNPQASPTTTGSPTPQTPGELARAVIVDALEAQQVYYVDNLWFAAGSGGELEVLRRLDPSIAWGTAVIVQVPAEEFGESLVVVLRAPLSSGESLCLALVTTEQDAGLWYARAATGAKCPKVRAGMRGWGADDTSWGPA
jgi:hypothetical protein